MAGNPKALIAARAPVPCPECGKQIGRNNLVRHRRTHGVDVPSSNGRGRAKGTTLTAAQRKRFNSERERSRIVGAYLEQLDVESEQRASGRRYSARGAHLGALPGFPNFSADPDEIERAAAAIAERALEVPSYVKALELQQRVLELRQIAGELRETGGVDQLEQQFVEVAAAWATERGISYQAFRVMGVPARVLKAAGISP